MNLPSRRQISKVLVSVGFGMTVLASCSDDSDSNGNDAFTVADSANVQIVRSLRPSWEDEPVIVDSEPILEIGEVDGDAPYILYRIVGVARTGRGEIVVGDGGSSELRFFTGDGTHIRSVGGQGEGPGEFTSLRAVFGCGDDKIYAFDRNWQLSVFDDAGQFIEKVVLHEPGGQRTPYRVSCNSGGNLVITGWGDELTSEAVSTFVSSADVTVISPKDSLIARLGRFPSSERIGGPQGSGPHPLGRSTLVGGYGDGTLIATSHAFEVLQFDGSGKLKRVIRGPERDLSISPEIAGRWIVDALEAVPPPLKAQMEQQYSLAPLPEQLPAYSDMRVDADQRIWLREFALPADAALDWWVFAPAGNLLGTVRMPDRLKIMGIGSDQVFGVFTDSLGVEKVRVHRVDLPSS